MKKQMMIFAAVVISLTACDKPNVIGPDDKQEQTDNTGNAEGEGESTKLKGVTFKLEEINVTDAYFTGTVKEMTPDLIVGIHWDYDPIEHISNTTIKSTTDFYDGQFVLYVNDLPSNSTIYYMPYVHRNGMTEYGDCLSFKTAKPTMTVDKVEVKESSAFFMGTAELDRGLGGIVCSTYKDVSLENYAAKLELDRYSLEGKSYTLILSGLQEYTTYYYRTFYLDGGLDEYVCGEVESFSTGTNPYDAAIKDLSLSSAMDLSAQGTANCYIVSTSGLYKIKAVKGNDTNQIISGVSQPAIIWESFGTDVEPNFRDLISEICFKDGYLVFKTASRFREGNSVIAVKDENGYILWSWHIWMTDKPQEHVYKNDLGTMMDRNLGATSATPGDVGALGLYYQWGRKDPFIGSSSISDGVEAKSTIAWVWGLSTKKISNENVIDYAIANPTTFIVTDGDDGRWYETESLDNSLWKTSLEKKSMYDPCPIGWRVPDSKFYADFYEDDYYSSVNFSKVSRDYYNRGCLVSISSPSTTWYPAAGLRSGYYYGGRFSSYEYGFYWTANSTSSWHGTAYRFKLMGIDEPRIECDDSEYGCFVRCYKE